LKSVPQNLITAPIIDIPLGEVKGWAGKIVEPAAPNATHMVVPCGTAVEPGLLPADIEPLNRPELVEQLQVAIHRPKADSRQAATDDVIQLRSRGVRLQVLEFLQNDLPLPGVAVGLLVAHVAVRLCGIRNCELLYRYQ
jgi:hypothetical protein